MKIVTSFRKKLVFELKTRYFKMCQKIILGILKKVREKSYKQFKELDIFCFLINISKTVADNLKFKNLEYQI